MGINRLFWPQALLDQWIVDEKISIQGEKLTLKTENKMFMVRQAVLFTADVGDGEDKYRLIGRVKEVSALEAMGAEHYMDSVIIEDSAYEVTCGFVGDPMEDLSLTRPRSQSPMSSLSGEDDRNEKELLAKFLIENL